MFHEIKKKNYVRKTSTESEEVKSEAIAKIRDKNKVAEIIIITLQKDRSQRSKQ